MWAWLLLMAVMVLLSLFSVYFISVKIGYFSFVRGALRKNKRRVRLILMGEIFIILVMLVAWMNLWNGLIIFLHLLTFWLISDFIAFIIRKMRKAPKTDWANADKSKRYYQGAIVIVFSVVYLCVGAYMDYHVWEKDYTVTTDKNVGSIKVAMIADSHMGTTFGGDGFAEHLKAIEATNPDLLIIAGDYVDDDSSKEDMEKACQALGDVQTTYGVFYVFGNHDKGYFESRDYSAEDLINCLEENGVVVLQDEVVLIDDRFYIIGRADRSESYRGVVRAEMDQLVQDLDQSKYMIVVDHQPHDYDAQEKANVDLVLSGHTHGGQLFPVNLIEMLVHADDKVYGLEKRGNTNFIVTSGISDWAIKFKTCCRSEFVIVNIEGEEE